MAPQSGLGDNLMVGGVDLTGDVTSVDQMSGGPAMGDATTIKKFANARLALLRSGDWQFTGFADVNSGAFINGDAYLKTLPLTDAVACYLKGSAIGNAAAAMVCKQINFDPTRDNSGNLTFKTELQSNAFGYEWGEQLTPGIRTDSAATNGTSIDDSGGASTPGVPASGTPVANTSPLPSTVVVSGGTGTNVAINGVPQGTFDGTYVVPPNGGTITLTYTGAPTWTWTYQSTLGAVCYMQAFAPFTGTSCTVTVQSAPDNSTWTTVAAFSAFSAAPTSQRVFSGVVTVGKWLRVITTGTFTASSFLVVVNRADVAGFTVI